MPMIEANGAEFYYELEGAGQPVIIISGYTGDYQAGLPILEALKSHFQILVFDNRGVGRTKDDGSALSANLMAQDVMALANVLNLKSPHIVGLSMGGTIAQCVASDYSGDIGKLALVVTSAKWRRAMIEGLRVSLRLQQMGMGFDVVFKSKLSWVFGEKFLKDPKQVALLYELKLNQPYPQSVEDLERQFKVIEDFDGRDALNKIKAETLVVHGTEDIISLPFESKFLEDKIPSATRLELDAAHAVTVEANEALSSALINFFK